MLPWPQRRYSAAEQPPQSLRAPPGRSLPLQAVVDPVCSGLPVYSQVVRAVKVVRRASARTSSTTATCRGNL